MQTGDTMILINMRTKSDFNHIGNIATELFGRTEMRYFVCLCLAVTIFATANAQQSPSADTSMSAILTRMRSNDMSTREKSFDDMLTLTRAGNQRAETSGRGDMLASFFAQHPDQADRIIEGLVELLNTENDCFILGKNGGADQYTEKDSEYYASLINVVSRLNDERTIPALVGAMTTGGMATAGLLKYGQRALGPVLEQLKSPNALVRSVALGIGIELLRKHDGLPANSRIRELIRFSLDDPDTVVRRSAVQEIACLDGREEFVPVLEQLAKTDPARRRGKALDGGDADGFYPVRYDARQVLRKIRNHEGCSSE